MGYAVKLSSGSKEGAAMVGLFAGNYGSGNSWATIYLQGYNPKFATQSGNSINILKTSDKYCVTSAASGMYTGIYGPGVYYGENTNAMTPTMSRYSTLSLTANQNVSYAVWGPSNWASTAKVILWYDPDDSIISV